MGLSGRVGARVTDELQQMLATAMLERRQKFAEEQAAKDDARADGRMLEDTRRFDLNQAADVAERTDRQRVTDFNFKRVEKQDREAENQKGVKRMLGEFITHNGAPDSDDERATLQGMAIQEDVDLPRALTEPSAKEKADAEKRERDDDRKEWKYRADYQEDQMRGRPRSSGIGDMSPAAVSAAFKLADDFARDSKPFIVMRDANQRVVTSSQNPDAAGDLSLIFGYMKMLDPNSVVRETEFANAQNAAGVPDQIRNLYNRAMSGERLNPTQRQQFVGQAQKLFSEAKRNQSQVVRQYTDRSRRFGIDPSVVVDELDTGAGAAPENAPAPAAGGPKVGEERVIKGVAARWDGKGWLPVKR